MMNKMEKENHLILEKLFKQILYLVKNMDKQLLLTRKPTKVIKLIIMENLEA